MFFLEPNRQLSTAVDAGLSLFFCRLPMERAEGGSVSTSNGARWSVDAQYSANGNIYSNLLQGTKRVGNYLLKAQVKCIIS